MLSIAEYDKNKIWQIINKKVEKRAVQPEPPSQVPKIIKNILLVNAWKFEKSPKKIFQ